MISLLVEVISVILYLILGGISMSERILKPKTQFYANCMGFIANLLFIYLELTVGHYLYVLLGIVYCVMSIYCIIKFWRLWKNAP